MRGVAVLIWCCAIGAGGLRAMDVTSSAFKDGEKIPVKYTCDGQDISPPLAWTGVPSGTQSLALIVEDPDAPSGTFVHWVVIGIPPTLDHLDENASKAGLPRGVRQGKNGAGKVGWFGPCPPSGTHHYLFRLLAVNVDLDAKEGASASDLNDAARGHVLAEAKLTGLYSRQKK